MDRLRVVGQVVVETCAHVQIDGFEFDEDQRQAVDKADEIGAEVAEEDDFALAGAT